MLEGYKLVLTAVSSLPVPEQFARSSFVLGEYIRLDERQVEETEQRKEEPE